MIDPDLQRVLDDLRDRLKRVERDNATLREALAARDRRMHDFEGKIIEHGGALSELTHPWREVFIASDDGAGAFTEQTIEGGSVVTFTDGRTGNGTAPATLLDMPAGTTAVLEIKDGATFRYIKIAGGTVAFPVVVSAVAWGAGMYTVARLDAPTADVDPADDADVSFVGTTAAAPWNACIGINFFELGQIGGTHDLSPGSNEVFLAVLIFVNSDGTPVVGFWGADPFSCGGGGGG